MSKEMFFTPCSMVIGKTGKSRTYTDATGQKYLQMIKDTQLVVGQQVEVIAEESDFKGKILTWIKLKQGNATKPVSAPTQPTPPTTPTTPPPQINGIGNVLQNEQNMWREKEKRGQRAMVTSYVKDLVIGGQITITEMWNFCELMMDYIDSGKKPEVSFGEIGEVKK